MEDVDELDALLEKWDEAHPETVPVFAPKIDPHLLADDELDVMPDVMRDLRLSDESITINALIENLDIVDAYKMWFSALWVPRTPRGRSEVRVRCPNPEHDDKDPSTYLNVAKQLGDCKSRCGGFDLYQMAAWNYDIADYQSKENFPKLKRMIASDLGYTVMKDENGSDYVAPLEESKPPTEALEPKNNTDSVPKEESGDNVVELHPAVPPADDSAGLAASAHAPTIEWERFAPEGTFLNLWMHATLGQDMPTEFYFWLGLMMIGLACGRDAVLLDNPTVFGNLFICLFGPSGIGKTKSSKAAMTLLREALPFKTDDGAGVLIVPPAGSAEALIDSFVVKVPDPDTNEDTGNMLAVRGLIHFDELSGLVSRANRVGNPMRSTLMEFYDGYDEVSTKSRSGGHASAKGSFASAITTTQPGAIRDLISQSDADSGFLNRWVFAAGPPRPLIAYGGKPVDLEPLVAPLRGIRSWAARGRGLELSGGALAAYEHFFHSTLAPIKLGGEEALSTRLDLTLKKLMLLFAANDGLDHPTVEVVERVIAVSSYLRKTYRFIQDEVNATDYSDIEEAIIECVYASMKKRHRPPTKSELLRSIPKRFNRDVLRKVIRDLTWSEQLYEREHKALNGRPMDVIDLAGR